MGNIKIAFGDVVRQMINHAVLIRKRKGQQQFGVVAGWLEQLRQKLVQLVALLNKKHAEQLVQPVFVLEAQHALALAGRKVQPGVKGRGDNVRLQLAGVFGGKHTDAGGQIIVHLHEADGNHPVEPGVGNLLHHVLKRGFAVCPAGFALHGGNKRAALGNFRAPHLGVIFCADVEKLQVLCGMGQRLGRARLRNAKKPRFVCNFPNELSPRPHGKAFDCSFVHSAFSVSLYQNSMLMMVSSSSAAISLS